MKANKSHISREDFQRYLENRMTDAERNAFERELQKHPFEAAALEGLQQIPAADLEKDLKELSGRISLNKARNKTRFWAAAATFLLLVSTGILWYQLREKSPVPKIAETKTLQENKIESLPSETQPQELVVPEEEGEKSGVQIAKLPAKIKVTKKHVAQEKVAVPEQKEELNTQMADKEEIEPVQFARTSEKAMVQTEATANKKPEIRIRGLSSFNGKLKSGTGSPARRLVVGDSEIVQGKVVSLDDSLPLPGVTVVEKGTSNGTVSDAEGKFLLKLTNTKDSVLVASFVGMDTKEFSPKNDSDLVVGLEPSQLALDELVTVAYGVSNETQATEKVKNAKPGHGMNRFRKYVADQAVLPKDYNAKKVVVKVQLLIDSRGNIASVENTNNAESSVFEETRQILLKGPVWSPKTINGTPVESEVSLRIVFKKEK